MNLFEGGIFILEFICATENLLLSYANNKGEKTCFCHMRTTKVNNKGADQPAHPRSLISTFVVRWLDSIIPLLAISEISSF